MKYRVEITETLQRVVEIEAESDMDAVDKASELCNDGEIDLSAEDFKSRDISLYIDD